MGVLFLHGGVGGSRIVVPDRWLGWQSGGREIQPRGRKKEKDMDMVMDDGIIESKPCSYRRKKNFSRITFIRLRVRSGTVRSKR